MLQNYVKIAFRNLARHKGYALINTLGLAIGLACCFLIVLYVQHELSYDRFHTHADRTYRLLRAEPDDVQARSAVTASGYAPHLMQALPEVEQTVRYWEQGATLQYEGQTRRVDNSSYADASMFEVFDFALRRGDPATALAAPASMVLTPAAAETWFGTADPVGKVLTLIQGEQRVDLKVTGVLAEVPSTSHLQFDYLVSFSTLRITRGEGALEDYTDYNYFTYVLLRPGVTADQLAAKFPDFLRATRGEEATQEERLLLQPLRDIHLTTDVQFDVGTNNDPRYLYIFSGIAVLILLIAAINFMNLSTARATLRAREVGIRKTVGAHRGQLMRQFFAESILSATVAMLLAFGLTVLAAPGVGHLLGRPLDLNPLHHPVLLLLLVAIGLATGALAGVYPAIVLSSFNPTRVLKGQVTRGTQGALLRKGLITAQFAIAVFLLVAVATIYNQLTYMKSRNLGFDKEQVLFVNLSASAKDQFEVFRQTLLRNPAVQNVSLTGNLPGRVNTMRGYEWPGAEDAAELQGRGLYSMFADPHYLETLGLELVQGRNFSEDLPTDVHEAYLLNEAAVAALGWEDPIDHPFKVWDREMGRVIGVVKDFHFKSLHQQIEPVVLYMHPEWSWQAAIRLAPGDLTETVDFVDATWDRFEAELPFNYRFLDEDFDRLYQSEERLGQLFGYFTGLAIFVACLGLFGLVSFTAEQRRKEIGVRKALGASSTQLVVLLSKDFGKLVLLAAVVATPVAYLVLHRWLEGFAYRIGLSPWSFLLVAAATLLVALATVSYQSIKAAREDPADILRYE